MTAAERSDGALELKKRGNELMALGRLADALASYDSALALEPDHLGALYNRGLALLALKRPAEALASYDRLLASTPDDAEALTERGNALLDLGRRDDALASYERALALAPDHVPALYSQGTTLASLQRFEEAAATLDRVLVLNPEFPDALRERGAVLAALGRRTDALASYERALALAPEDADLLAYRGNVLLELARAEEALASYDRALAVTPEDPSLLVRRAHTLVVLKRYEDAVASYDRALLRNPQDVAALNFRGNALLALNRYQDALASYDRALALEPNNVTLLVNRGNVLGELRRPQEALASYDRALALEPKLVPVLTNRGRALLDLLRNEEAIESYDRALAIDPGYAAAHNNRANVLQGLRRYEEAAGSYLQLTALEPDHDYAIGHLLTCQLHGFQWGSAASTMTVVENAIRQGKRAIAPFAFLAASDSPAAQLECARIYVADRYPASRTPLWTGKRYRHDRIRVAYLSADLREHAVAQLIIGLFEHHDRRKFETTAVYFGPQTDDAMQRRVKAAFERFINVRGESDGGVAKRLNDMEIDIAIDLNGFTTEARTGIFAHCPAPIQVNYLGYPGTMGAPYIDYIVADEFLIPRDHRSCYSEQVVYMPDCYQSNDRRRRIAERVPTRSEAGLPENGFVFCCFNNHYKITPKVFDVWMRLLGRVEGSVLWLLEVSDEARRAIHRETEARGIEPERLRFAPRMKPDEHLARHRLADLFLDTLPYNAHTTASDALWAGLPVVTCAGTAFAGRVAGSLLRAVGLPQLITDNMNDYEALAFALATDPARLREIKNRLARNRAVAPLFDTDRFRKHIEAAYVEMWERYQRGDPPADFAVKAVA